MLLNKDRRIIMKKKISIILAVMMLVLCFSAEDTMARSLLGDVASDPIILQQKAKKNTKFTQQNNVKYFQVTVKDTGRLKVTYSSDKLKKPVTITLCYDANSFETEKTVVKYDKKKKLAKGTLTSTRVMNPGFYTVIVETEKAVAKDTKFTLSTELEKVVYDDKEPNNDDANAQTVKIGSKKSTYHMHLSGLNYGTDMIDYFKFDLKDGQKVSLTASTNSAARIRVLLKKKTDTGMVVINQKENEQYFEKSGSKYTFKYNSAALEKGEYYVMFWLQEDQKEQVDYTFSAMTKS